MQLEIKFKSIAVRWFFNMFLIVVLIVCAVVIGFIAVVNSLYTEKIAMYAADITYEFNSLSETTPATFRDTAIDMAENFGFKDKLEVQVIDRDDNVVVTTTGFQPSDGKMADYEQAKLTGSAVADSKTSEGEHILAGTTALYDSSGRYIGAYRWITTLENADRRVSGLVITLVVTGLLVLAFCAFSGLFFIKSIVTPIRDVSNIARKIAMGDFGSRIEITKNDEIGELCDTINYMASELSQAENMKNDFISSVSHELRTPLTAIKGWGETAKMSIGTDEALVKRGIDVVLSEADRLSGLVEELLDFSRMETGRLSVVSQPLNISELLTESVDMYIELARQQGIELVFTRPAEDVTVLGDPNRLKQVFINIIDNAVKYTPQGGRVALTVESYETYCRINISDTGCGIPPEEIPKIFQRFYRGQSVQAVDGVGLGLPLARKIVQAQGGWIKVTSNRAGSQFSVFLPYR